MSGYLQPILVLFASLGLALAIWVEGSFRLRRRAVVQRVSRLALAGSGFRQTGSLTSAGRAAALAERFVDLFGQSVWPRQLKATRVVCNALVAAGAAAAALGPLLGLPWWFAGVAAAVVFVMTTYLILYAEQAKLARVFETMLADTIDMMVRMLRAGMPVTVAVERVGNEAQEPAGTIYREVAQWLRLGLPLQQAMRTVAERIKVRDFDFFAAALAIQSTVGGNLTATLESLAAVIRERNLALLKARAVTAQARLTANIILGILPAIMVIMQLTQPGYLNPLIDGSHGYQLIGFVVGSYLFALLTIRRMVSRVRIS